MMQGFFLLYCLLCRTLLLLLLCCSLSRNLYY